jgi:hypothetical protein
MAFAFADIGTHANGFLAIDGSSGEVLVDAEFVIVRISLRFV